MLPNIAVLRYSDTSLLQMPLDGSWKGIEFTTLSPEDSYNDMGYNQIKLCRLDVDTDISEELCSYTIANDNDLNEMVMICDNHAEAKEIIKYLAKEAYGMDIKDFISILV
jgi:hypothetical protein